MRLTNEMRFAILETLMQRRHESLRKSVAEIEKAIAEIQSAIKKYSK